MRAGALLLLAVAGGCALSLEIPDRCEVHDHCLAGNVCIDNHCVSEADACSTSRPCRLSAISPASADVGDTLDLDGVFGPKVEVYFPGASGNIRADLTSLSGHRAQVKVPPGAESGDLVVMTGGRIGGQMLQTLRALPFRRLRFEPALSTVRAEQTTAARMKPRSVFPRTRAAAVPTGLLAFAFGGEDDAGALTAVEHLTFNADGSLSTFSYDSALGEGEARVGAAALVAGEWLLLAGGTGADGRPLTSVRRAKILSSDGSLGAFEDAGALGAVRSDFAAALIGNRLVVAGGRDADGRSLATVESARIGDDGKLDAFEPEPDLPAPRARAAALVTDGAFWLIGGENESGALAVIERGALLDARISGYSNGGALTIGRAGAGVARVGRQLFIVGGDAGGAPIAAIERASVGELLDFKPAGSLRTARSGAALISHETTLAVVGGRDAAGKLAGGVEVMQLDGKAALDAFLSDTEMMPKRVGAPAVVLGRHFYMLGGGNDTSFTNDLLHADVLPGGALATIQPTPNPLKRPRMWPAVAVIGTSLYVIGGLAGTTIEPTTERAEIRFDGTLGTFNVETSLSLVTARHTANLAVLGDSLCVFGGRIADVAPTTSIECAPIVDGRLMPFQAAKGALTFQRYGAMQMVDGETAYLGGGETVSETTLSSIQRVRWDGAQLIVEVPSMDAEKQLTVPRLNAGSLPIGDQWYAVGGFRIYFSEGIEYRTPLKTIERGIFTPDGIPSGFEPQRQSLLEPRNNPVVVVLGGFAYALGGQAGKQSLDTRERATLVSGN